MKKYTFEVAKDANKIEIARAVEELFGVKVAEGQHPATCRGKSTPPGQHTTATLRAWKKAIVTLTEDSKTIEFFEGMM